MNRNQNRQETNQEEGRGEMTVREAGHMGGQKVRRLVQEGEQQEGETNQQKEGNREE